MHVVLCKLCWFCVCVVFFLFLDFSLWMSSLYAPCGPKIDLIKLSYLIYLIMWVLKTPWLTDISYEISLQYVANLCDRWFSKIGGKIIARRTRRIQYVLPPEQGEMFLIWATQTIWETHASYNGNKIYRYYLCLK